MHFEQSVNLAGAKENFLAGMKEVFIMNPLLLLVLISPLFIFLAVWLKKSRGGKTLLFYSCLFAAIMPFWLLIGLIYALGPWHDLRSGLFRVFGYIVAGPVYLYELLFGFSANFLTLVLYSIIGGFLFGLVLGGIIKAAEVLHNIRGGGKG